MKQDNITSSLIYQTGTNYNVIRNNAPSKHEYSIFKYFFKLSRQFSFAASRSSSLFTIMIHFCLPEHHLSSIGRTLFVQPRNSLSFLMHFPTSILPQSAEFIAIIVSTGHDTRNSSEIQISAASASKLIIISMLLLYAPFKCLKSMFICMICLLQLLINCMSA